jgi:hypothetical protein
MSKLFFSADCNAETLAFLAESVPSFAGKGVPKGPVGFHLVKNTLVPYSFLQDLECELMNTRLNCFAVTKISELFEEAFLASLTASEMDVLGECVLLLIEKGYVPFSLINTKEAA